MANLNPRIGVWLVRAARGAARGLPWLLSGSLLACLVLIGGQGQPAPSTQPASEAAQEVRAQRFIVVDSTGKERARLGMRPEGGAELVVLANTGQAAAWVAVHDNTDWPVIAVCGRDGRVVGQLNVLDQAYPVFMLHDPSSGEKRIAMGVARDEAAVAVFSKSGNSLASLRVGEEGLPRLLIRDEQARGRILLAANPDGSCLLDLSDSERTRVRAGVSGTGDPAFVIFDKDGKLVWWHAKPPQ